MCHSHTTVLGKEVLTLQSQLCVLYVHSCVVSTCVCVRVSVCLYALLCASSFCMHAVVSNSLLNICWDSALSIFMI